MLVATLFDNQAQFHKKFDQFTRNGYLSKTLVQNLGIMIATKAITVECLGMGEEDGHWDGEMFVIFKKIPKTSSVVNAILQHARADEMFMQDEKTLRLWWD